MDARAEGDVGLVGSAGVEVRGVGKLRRIAVRGAEHQSDFLALGDADAAVEFDILECVAGEHVQRRIKAQGFLHRRIAGCPVGKKLVRRQFVLQDRLHRISGLMGLSLRGRH